MAVDPERVKWKAAQEAGYTGSGKALGVTAAQVIARPRVREYMASLGSQAIELAEAKTGQIIADLAEALAFKTTVMRTRIGDYITDQGEIDLAKVKEAPPGIFRDVEVKSTTDSEGQVYAQHKLKSESALSAAQSLVKHYEIMAGAGKHPTGNTYVLNLTTLDPQMLRELYARGWLSASHPLLEAK